MNINHVGVLLAALVCTGHALRISDHVTNYTAAVLGLDNNATAFASEPVRPLPPLPLLAPPLPPRPIPKAPREPYLPLFDNANDEVWDRAKCKGANFVRAMRGSDRDAGQVFKPPRDSGASKWENLDFSMILQQRVRTDILTCCRCCREVGMGGFNRDDCW